MYLCINPYVKVVAGLKRVTLNNLHDGTIHFFDASILDLLHESKKKSLYTIKLENDGSEEVIDHYLEYLSSNNLAKLQNSPAPGYFYSDDQKELSNPTPSADILYIEPRILESKKIRSKVNKIINSLSVKAIVFVLKDKIDSEFANRYRLIFLDYVSLIGLMPLSNFKAEENSLSVYDFVFLTSWCKFKEWNRNLCRKKEVKIIDKKETLKVDSLSSLCCSYENFIRLKTKSYYSDQLYLTKDGDLTFNYLSLKEGLGAIRIENSLAEIIDFMNTSLDYKKERSPTCLNCELRATCNHPIVKRENRLEPLDCTYDYLSGRFILDMKMKEIYSDNNLKLISDIHISTKESQKLSSFISTIKKVFGVSKYNTLIEYNLYSNSNSSARHSKLIANENGRDIIQLVTSKLFDSHEIIHSILYSVNKNSKFVVSEAYATIFNNDCSEDIDFYGCPELPDRRKIKSDFNEIIQKWNVNSHSDISMATLKSLGQILKYVLVNSGYKPVIDFYKSDQSLLEFQQILKSHMPDIIESGTVFNER